MRCDRGCRQLDRQQRVNSHLRGPYRILHRKYHVIGTLDALTYKSKILGIGCYRKRPLAPLARHEYTGDIRHQTADYLSHLQGAGRDRKRMRDNGVVVD